MIIHDESYERLRRAIEVQLTVCEMDMTLSDAGSIEAIAYEDDLIEWRRLLRHLEEAHARARASN